MFFRVDDQFHSHPKAMMSSLAAVGLWAFAGSWSSANLTDGYVPDHVLPRLSNGQPELAQELVAAGLWRRTRGGYKFHDWTDRNATGKEVKNKREKMAERQKRWREGQCRRVTDGVTNGVTNSAPSPSPLDASNEASEKNTKKINSPPDGDSSNVDFDHFYALYPRKKARQAAVKAWRQALKSGVDPQTIIAGAQRYADECAAHGTDQKFVAHPATWLNQHRWLDESTPVPQRNGHQPYQNPVDQAEYFEDIV